jgi:hypothetical protein
MSWPKPTPTRQLIRRKCKGKMGIVITEPVRTISVLSSVFVLIAGTQSDGCSFAVERSNILKSLTERGFTAGSRSVRKTSGSATALRLVPKLPRPN